MDRKTLMIELQGTMNQQELAERLGINQSTVSRLSDDSYQPKQGVIAALLREFPDRQTDILGVFFGVNIADTHTANGKSNCTCPEAQ